MRRPINIFEDNFIMSLLLLSILLLSWVWYSDRKKIGLYFNALFGGRFVEQLERNDNDSTNKVAIILRTINLLVLSIFSFQIISTLNVLPENVSLINSMLLLFVALIVLGIMKFAFVKISSWLMELEGLGREYLFYQHIFYSVMGVLLLPIVILIEYQQIMSSALLVKLIGVLIGIGLIYRIVMLIVKIFVEFNVSMYHIILYICTLEIIPLVAICKWLADNFR